MIKALFFSALLLASFDPCFAHVIVDHGKRGETFPIKEKSLLEVIQQKLRDLDAKGKIPQLQQEFSQKVKARLLRPAPVAGIKNTIMPRRFYYDPTFTLDQDIKGAKDHLLYKKGTKVNPLTKLSWGAPLIFINGEEEAHVNWALTQEGKIILIKGSPLTLNKSYGKWFYFDQGGALTRKLGITQVPALVRQAGAQLLIEEILI